ncbi:MAG: dependent oxidoreductase [Planctomycetaceae bacterium]|nr:dependent oxidoreductase [Planctomycetaceae bacterium]
MNIDTDVLIFGGGCAGLWLLDELRRKGVRALLLESGAVGGTQTTGSQGILHGGTKYVLQGIFSASAGAVRDMPARWRESLAGAVEPDLSQTRFRSRHCYLWRSDSWQSYLGMVGAQAFLQVKPVPLPDAERPALLAKCPGQVFRLDEEVIDTTSFAGVLAERNRGLIHQIDAAQGLEFQVNAVGRVTSVLLCEPGGSRELSVHVDRVVLAAGAGNDQLRAQIGLTPNAMQRRPLHMVLVRGDLPQFNGHCIDGAKTRVTITSDIDSRGRGVWQIGGQLAEDGVRLGSAALIAHAQRELSAVLPGWKSGGLEWATYRIDRAEARTADGSRPNDVQLLHEHNVLTIWPTKLVLAPRMAQQAIEQLGVISHADGAAEFRKSLIELNWPAPVLALPPWELQSTWISGD